MGLFELSELAVKNEGMEKNFQAGVQASGQVRHGFARVNFEIEATCSKGDRRSP